jgi:MFS family permease
MFRDVGFSAANAAAFCMTAAILSAAFLVSEYFQLGRGDSPFATGIRFLPWTATPILVAPLGGALVTRVGVRAVMSTGLGMQALGLGWFALLARTGLGYGELVIPLVIAGIGVSLALPAAPTAVMVTVTPSEAGKASSVLNTLQRFGGAFGVAGVSVVFARYGGLANAQTVLDGFRPALAAAAGLSLLGAVAALAAAGRPPSPQASRLPVATVPAEVTT